MVVVKGLNTFKGRVSGDRNTRKSDGGRTFKVYTENDKVKTHSRSPVATGSKKKSVPAKAEASHIHTICPKVGLNKLEKNRGKSENSVKTNVRRKVLADITNFQKNETFDGARPGASVGTGVRNAKSLSSKPLTGKPKRSSSQVIDGYRTLGRDTTKDLKIFNKERTELQGRKPVGDVAREYARNLLPPTRKSLPVLKPVDKVDTCDMKKGFIEKKLKGKEHYGFRVKTKVVTNVVPQVSNAWNYLWKNRASDGFLKIIRGWLLRKEELELTEKWVAEHVTDHYLLSTSHFYSCAFTPLSLQIVLVSEGQPTCDARSSSKRLIKPTVKTAVGISRTQRVSRSSSVFSKSTSGTSISSKKETTSKINFSKHTASTSCKQPAQQGFPSYSNNSIDASTSHISDITANGRFDRRKSYTSLLIDRSKLLKGHAKVVKQEFLPNIYDDRNHLEVADYVDEIYQHYWVNEAHNQSLKKYMEIQTEITPQMRGILINWLIEVHLKFDLMQETLYLMVTLLDHYLSLVSIKMNEMQLVGLTALLLASKYEDFWHPKVMELISISAEAYTRDQMLGMETAILKKLKFRLNVATPYVFMLRFLRAAQAGKKLENLAFYLMELCLVEYEALEFKPSLVCASAIYVGRCTLQLAPAWTPLLCKHSHYEEGQMRECAEMILRFHRAAGTGLLKVTYEKYTSADNCRVASIKPLDRLPPPPPLPLLQ